MILIGIFFGAFAPDGGWIRSRAFFGGLASAAAFTLVALLSYVVAPDWMWMYFVAPGEMSWVVPLMPLAYLATFVLGFAAAVGFRRIGRASIWIAGATAVAGNLLLIVATWDRYRFVGTAEEWAAGRASPLFSTSPTGEARTIGLLVPLFIVVLAASAFMVWRGNRAAAVRR